MAIRNGKDGDIVYLNNGSGPKGKIVGKREFFAVYYNVKILEVHFPWEPGDTTEVRAGTLSRRKVEDGE